MPRLTPEARVSLHVILDQLIDQVEALEALVDQEDERTPVGHDAFGRPIYRPLPLNPIEARQLLERALGMVRNALGHEVLCAALDLPGTSLAEKRAQVRHWLWSMYGLLQRGLLSASHSAASVLEVMDALSALDAGEVQPIFRAQTGKNRRANRWTLARRKLAALVWKKRLLALGKGEKHANHELTNAFGEQWDTMRKWKKECVRILGEEQVEYALSSVSAKWDPYLNERRGLGGVFAPQDAAEGLARDGQAYRQELAKAKSLKAGASE